MLVYLVLSLVGSLWFLTANGSKSTANMVMQVPEFGRAESDTLLQIFDQIKKNISVSQNEKSRKRSIVNRLLQSLTTIMSEEETLFKKMFTEFKYTGSYFDGLRINDANEFDINLVLSLPVRKDKIRVDTSVGPPTYALLALDSSDGDPIVNLNPGELGRFQRLLDNSLDNSWTVHPEKVLNWMQSVVTKALNRKSELLNQDVRDVQFSKSGPAWTLKIRLGDQTETVDVDLVSSFRVEWPKWRESEPGFQPAIINSVIESKRRLYLIPKLLQGQSNQYWRKHFPDAEEELLNGKVAAKPVIRILKLLRDNMQWSNVASYYIKTLVMTEVWKTRATSNQWLDSRLPQLVFMMMAKLADCFQQRNLPHVLYNRQNLFQAMSDAELDNYFHRMRNIIFKCRENVQNVKLFFSPRSTLTPMEARGQSLVLEGTMSPQVHWNMWQNDMEDPVAVEEVPAQGGRWCAIL